MPRYFMGDTRLAGWERMMMDPSRRPPADTVPQQKGHQKDLTRNHPTRPHPCERKIEEGSA